ncbi:hypothetical protein O181_041134 [Austropuccinia psidii MF-1]|uniref:Retrovirus-related Pol polyprotein from transposon TNT 1-94 n=1 Tax=Austropuccinia psidii MF-1 TaxID=1389203 RepID=A0A9Q3DDT8_9BASI|nr:hypothetical protein [Austropuccinia psidii MF-1]
MHVLKYLKGTSEIGLVYKRNTSKLPVAYSDADWGNCRVTRRSTTGYLILFNGNLIILKTRKQPTLLLSSAEAEYQVLTDLTSELLWFKQFSEEINILKMTRAIPVHEDNKGCIDTANSDCNTNTRHMKHINIQLHFIRDLIENKIIKLTYTPTTNMLADFLTKSVSRPAIRNAMQELKLLMTGDKGGVWICDLSQSYNSSSSGEFAESSEPVLLQVVNQQHERIRQLEQKIDSHDQSLEALLNKFNLQEDTRNALAKSIRKETQMQRFPSKSLNKPKPHKDIPTDVLENNQNTTLKTPHNQN